MTDNLQERLNQLKLDLKTIEAQHERFVRATINAVESYGIIITPCLKEVAELDNLPEEAVDPIIKVLQASKYLISALLELDGGKKHVEKSITMPDNYYPTDLFP